MPYSQDACDQINCLSETYCNVLHLFSPEIGKSQLSDIRYGSNTEKVMLFLLHLFIDYIFLLYYCDACSFQTTILICIAIFQLFWLYDLQTLLNALQSMKLLSYTHKYDSVVDALTKRTLV